MAEKMVRKRKAVKDVDCLECVSKADCCRVGAWIDLEEAKKIIDLGLKGDFFHLEKDKDFPSGYCIGTSIEDEPCSFLDADGLCSVHKVEYKLKPKTCKEFPYENNELSAYAYKLCTLLKRRIKNNKKK